MELPNDTLRSAYKTSVIICIAMMLGVLIYVAVAVMMSNLQPPWKGIVLTPEDSTYQYVRYGMVILAIAIPLLIVKILAALNLTREKLENPVPRLVAHTVFVSAGCESGGVLGIVLFLLAGNVVDMFIFAGISFVFFAIFFPRFSRWEELIESGRGGPRFE